MNKKLIKLNTFDDNCVFNAQFNDELIIEPFSEIAFQSCSIKRNNARLKVDAFNQDIQFQISSTAGLKTITLDHDTYSKIHNDHLLKQLRDKGNSQLSVVNPKELGTELTFEINGDGKFEYNAIHQQYVNLGSVNTANVELRGLQQNSKIVSKPAGDPATGLLKDNYLFSKVPFIGGCGVIRCQIRNFVNAGINGMGCALTTRIDKLTDGTITFEDCDFAVSTNNTTNGNYQIRHPSMTGAGDFTQSAEACNFVGANNANNDIFGIQLDQGIMKIVIHHNGSDVVLSNDIHDYDKIYYGVFFTLGERNNARITKCFFNPTPTFTAQNQSFDTEEETYTAPAPPTSRGRRTNFKFNFPDDNTASYFGFNRRDNSSEIVRNNFQLIANNIFSNTFDADNYLVELLNIPLESYDSFINGRFNLLGVIPVSERVIDNDSGLIQYEPFTPYYISINNKFPISLRNIDARILSADHNQIVVDGMSSLNILIRSPNKE